MRCLGAGGHHLGRVRRESITLRVLDDAEFSERDEGAFASWAGGGDPVSAGPSRYHQDLGQIDKLWILDMDGQPISSIPRSWRPERPPRGVPIAPHRGRPAAPPIGALDIGRLMEAYLAVAARRQ
ncbi:MAG: hypothetical protein M3406_00945 [Chloroflexota bacterium]|nr:hypothetical protein [Chloroflexota bacterium]